jgi:ADP-ribose pyrophosphatase YjhB (NUDIX family)
MTIKTYTFTKALGAVAALVLATGFSPGAAAQGKIVCWKDAAGKVVGCGDKVPLEYVNSGTKELDKGGNVRKTGESADEAAKRKALEKEQAQVKAEEQKRVAEQKRQDSALMNTFTNEKEIDLKRDRELQAIDNNITQQRAALKLANDRLAEAQQRVAAFEKGNKDKKPVPPVIKDDLTRAENDKARLEQDIAAKEKSKQDTATTYAAYKKRYQELKGTTTAEPAAPAPAPAKK